MFGGCPQLNRTGKAARVIVDTWPTSGLHPAYIWSSSGLHLVYIWSSSGLHLVYIWSTSGLHLVEIWSISGLHLVYIWSTSGSTSGLHLVHIWSASGLHLAYIRSPSGLHLVYIWSTSDIHTHNTEVEDYWDENAGRRLLLHKFDVAHKSGPEPITAPLAPPVPSTLEHNKVEKDHSGKRSFRKSEA